MPRYPQTLLIATTLPYAALPLLIALRARAKHASHYQEISPLPERYAWWKVHAFYAGYGALSAIDNILEAFANPHLGSFDYAIVGAAIPIPVTGFLAWLLLRQSFHRWQLMGSAIVLVGGALQLLGETHTTSNVYWIVAFAIGVSFGCLYTLLWEFAFDRMALDPGKQFFR